MVAYHDARRAIDSCPDDALYKALVETWIQVNLTAEQKMQLVGARMH
ncbi:MAG: hypothetical protein P1S60_20550 [Anaerolineae bacterium]|nr:hypothetical protein [Anaerolineae bacterium]